MHAYVDMHAIAAMAAAGKHVSSVSEGFKPGYVHGCIASTVTTVHHCTHVGCKGNTPYERCSWPLVERNSIGKPPISGVDIYLSLIHI